MGNEVMGKTNLPKETLQGFTKIIPILINDNTSQEKYL